jgi:predicted esterase
MLRAGAAPGAAALGLVLLHGRGAGAQDILQVAGALALPDAACAAPEAPGLSWWPTSFLAPAAAMAPHVQAGLAAVDAAIAVFEAEGLPRDRIGVLGFSQGGCLAAEYLARKGAGLGFGVALSAGLIGRDDAGMGPDAALYGNDDKRFDYETDLGGTRVYMSCHRADPHIPFKRFDDSRQVLERLGAAVTARPKPGPGHGIDQDDILAIRRLLTMAPA